MKIDISMCLGDPDKPVAQNKPFMSIDVDEIDSKLDELKTFMTKDEIRRLLELRDKLRNEGSL